MSMMKGAGANILRGVAGAGVPQQQPQQQQPQQQQQQPRQQQPQADSIDACPNCNDLANSEDMYITTTVEPRDGVDTPTHSIWTETPINNSEELAAQQVALMNEAAATLAMPERLHHQLIRIIKSL